MHHATLAHDQKIPALSRVTRFTTDTEAQDRYERLPARPNRAARVNTRAQSRDEPGSGPRPWRNRNINSEELRNQEMNRITFANLAAATGIRPRNIDEADELIQNMDPVQAHQVRDITLNNLEENVVQNHYARLPARPFAENHASRQTGFERRNPGADRHIDPAGNEREEQRLLLEQSARFLPAELLHMIRPDKRKHEPDTTHPGYNREIRAKLDAPVPRNYVHH